MLRVACVIEISIYVSVGTCESRRIEIFDHVGRKWKRVKLMVHGRCFHRLVSYKRRLLAIGNRCADSSVEVYDLVFVEWNTALVLEDAVKEYIIEQAYACTSVGETRTCLNRTEILI